MKGTVVSVFGNLCKVQDQEKNIFSCNTKGAFKVKRETLSNPVVVGDKVFFKIESEKTGVIEDIEKRKNYVIRKAINATKEKQLLVSNIDKILIITSVVQPRFVQGFMDRLLANCEAYGIESIIIINKQDVISTAQEKKKNDEVSQLYKNIGYDVLQCSAKENIEIETLASKIRDKTVVCIGQSGVGKSSIINALAEENIMGTAKNSTYNKKGKHTTTFAQMFQKQDICIIDTPGIKQFGFVETEKEELKDYFREFLFFQEKCRFVNCNHIFEPGCAIIDAVKNGEIHENRYRSYAYLFNSEEFIKRY